MNYGERRKHLPPIKRGAENFLPNAPRSDENVPPMDGVLATYLLKFWLRCRENVVDLKVRETKTIDAATHSQSGFELKKCKKTNHSRIKVINGLSWLKLINYRFIL